MYWHLILVLPLFFCLLQFVKEDRSQPEELGRPGVIISNHVSYLDILYHMSSSFPSFVAKVCDVTNFCSMSMNASCTYALLLTFLFQILDFIDEEISG